jgi:magnesium chelatase subunit D
MKDAGKPALLPLDSARMALALLAIDPFGLKGALFKGSALEAAPLTEEFHSLLHPGAPWRKLPAGISDERMIGGLDLAATLAVGRPILSRGVLAEADGGALLVPMAERLPRHAVAYLCAALDEGDIRIERDGFAALVPARFALLAFDESEEGEDRASIALADRLAFRIDLDACRARSPLPSAVHSQPSLLAGSWTGEGNAAMLETLCAAALAFGVSSLRAPILAARAARAHALLNGRNHVSDEDIAIAAGLVIAPRATQLPAMEADEETPEQPSEDQANAEREHTPDPPADRKLEDIVLDAIRAALPEKLLAGLIEQTRLAARGGGSGADGGSALRGRPIGAKRGEPRQGRRLVLLDTLRAAAPWQPIRRREGDSGRIVVHRQDWRIRRFRQQAESTTIFVVDASGSSALNRLAEAKGAVELLLADCYVRRDSVSLIAFRGESAETILPPTRSLVRAKRSLAGLPGGGGTPLAAALDAAASAAREARRKGRSAIVVVLTDGKANICRDGTADRARALAEAMGSARIFAESGSHAILIDTSPRPQRQGREIAAAMGARYLPLPQADSARVSAAIRDLSGPGAKAAG